MRKIMMHMLTSDPGPQKGHIPVSSKIISVSLRDTGTFVLYFLTSDESELTEPRTFQVFDNGQPIPDDAMHLASKFNNTKVYHLFERFLDD